MSFIQDISISLVRGTKALAQKGFGLPLILGATTTGVIGSTETHRLFSSMEDVAAVYPLESMPEYQMAEAMFSQEPCPPEIAIYSRNTQTITAALNAIQSTHPDFYAIFIPESDATSLHDAGDWANANKKFFFGCSDAVTVLDDRNVDREAYIIHDVRTDYPECAWAGQNLPKEPGSITWKWKSLSGQNAPAYTTTELNAIRAASGQALTEIAGMVIVNEGKTTSGEFIDVIRGQDWVKARMEEELYSLFFSNDKIAMDNTGIAQVESVLRTVLKKAGENGIIAKATTETELNYSDDKVYMYKVKVPDREDILPTDRAARRLTDVEFTYYLAGAIHEAVVSGKILV